MQKPDRKTPKPGGSPGGAKPGSSEKPNGGVSGVDETITTRDRDNKLPGDDVNGSDPTEAPRGLVDRVDASLKELHRDIQKAFSGPSQDITTPTERSGVRPPNDERLPVLNGSRPTPEEEEPSIVAGDPDDLGERGRRRRRRDDVNASPVLRRGLLGV